MDAGSAAGGILGHPEIIGVKDWDSIMDSNCGEGAKHRHDRGGKFVMFGVTEEEFVAQFAQCLELAVELGNCRYFRSKIEDWGGTDEVSRARSGSDSDFARRITAAIEANEAHELIEVEFGPGAALKLDHPFNQELIRHGRLAPERVEAARRRITQAEPT